MASAAREQFEQVLRQFEDAWERGEQPELDRFLAALPADGPQLLLELVHIDLERRLKAGQQVRVEEYLRRYPALAGDSNVVLDLIASEHRLRQRREFELSLQEYRRRFPDLAADLTPRLTPGGGPRAADGTADRTALTAGPSPNAARGQRAAEGAVRPPVVGQRFQILRPHARGGLGEVFVALDQELRREVALKEIQQQYADDPERRARFVLEAEVTGRLEHPGVVPVYGLGTYPDGRPFYAMRFIRGESLQDAITRFHQADGPGRDPGERELQFRQLLGKLVALCNAIAYSHSRGVLHRDLKPANVMLGPYGETLVVDWGLARALDGKAEERGPAAEQLRPSLAADVPPTQTGAVVGTPAFMSPEQALGRRDQVGPAADVYSLGATFYCLLTGQAPFQGEGVLEVLERVCRGDFLPPGRVKPGVPPGLQAVCLKAMAQRPGERYASAQALADDLEHWLAGEPVSAWAEPWTVRARRWVGRHRTLVTAAAAALLVATVGLTAATALLQAANQRERTARGEAEKNFKLACQAVDRYFMQVSSNPRLKAGGLDGLRRDLLAQAREFYQELVRRRQDDPDLRAEQAGAYWRLGRLAEDTGALDEAIRLSEKSRTLYEQLVREYPAVAAYQEGLAAALNNLVIIHDIAGHPDKALAAYDRLIPVSERLIHDHPNSTTYRERLATTLLNLGTFHNRNQRFGKAEAVYKRSLELHERLVRAHPGVRGYRNGLGLNLNNLAWLYQHSGRPQQAEAAYKRALALRERLARDHPDVPNYLDDVAGTLLDLALLYQNSGRFPQAQAALEKALPMRERLAREHPEVPDYRDGWASILHDLGYLFTQLQKPADAEAFYTKAIPIYTALARDFRTVPAYRHKLARTLHNLGWLYQQSGKPDRAEKTYREALPIRERLVRDFPKVPDYQDGLARLLRDLGVLSNQRGKLAQAEDALGRALALRERLVRAHPDVPDYHSQLTQVRTDRASLLANRGSHARAAAEAETLARGKGAKGLDFYNAACVYSLCSAAAGKDPGLSPAERGRLVEKYAGRAVALLQQARKAGYFDPPDTAAWVKKDTDLDPLRKRSDFLTFLRDLGKGKAPPK
jgi:serine/threonine-protein kinase